MEHAPCSRPTCSTRERHPAGAFRLHPVEPVDADHAKVCGDLTLRGVTRPLCMDVTLNALKRHPLPPFRRTAGFSATATLSRADFGIDAWKNVIGDSVELRIEAEAVRARGARRGNGTEPANEHRAAGRAAKPHAEPEPTDADSAEPAH